MNGVFVIIKTKDMIKRFFKATVIVLLAGLGMTSCSEDDLDAVIPEGASVNFFAHSEYLAAVRQTAGYAFFPILTDDKGWNLTNSLQVATYPYFNPGQNISYEYPTPNSQTESDETAAYYYRMPAGRRIISFMGDTLGVNIQTLEQDFPSRSYHLVYFTDKVRDDKVADYRVFNVPESRKPEHAGRFNYRLVNLSPDAGNLTVRFRKRSGGYTDTGASAGYAAYSEYVGVDTTGLVINNRLVLEVLDSGGDIAFTQRVNPLYDVGYHFVIGGFSAAQQGVKTPYAIDNNGSVTYRIAGIPANLQLTVRRIY